MDTLRIKEELKNCSNCDKKLRLSDFISRNREVPVDRVIELWGSQLTRYPCMVCYNENNVLDMERKLKENSEELYNLMGDLLKILKDLEPRELIDIMTVVADLERMKDMKLEVSLMLIKEQAITDDLKTYENILMEHTNYEHIDDPNLLLGKIKILLKGTMEMLNVNPSNYL